MRFKLYVIVSILVVSTLISVALIHKSVSTDKSHIPLVAIANYGPHSSLDSTIVGLKQELARQGFVENKTIRYLQSDVGFDTSLIPQMISNLKNKNPDLMVVLSTPIAQFAKNSVKEIPLVFSSITDPITAGLITDKLLPSENITGSSDQQDLQAMLRFAKKIIPGAKRAGLLYATGEVNDAALLKMMQHAIAAEQMSLISIAIDSPRDVPMRVLGFKDKVDFIYVGVSGTIQPSLPTIAAAANKMDIPVFNADDKAVKEGMVMASFGVNYIMVGANAGKLVAKFLNGTPINKLQPLYPSNDDHYGVVSKAKAKYFGLKLIADSASNIKMVD